MGLPLERLLIETDGTRPMFRRPNKPGCVPGWNWLEENLRYFESNSSISNRLWFTISIHAHDASNGDRSAQRIVRKFAFHPKCVGIGECGQGLYEHDRAVLNSRLLAFRAQASLATQLNKPLAVHARLVAR